MDQSDAAKSAAFHFLCGLTFLFRGDLIWVLRRSHGMMPDVRSTNDPTAGAGSVAVPPTDTGKMTGTGKETCVVQNDTPTPDMPTLWLIAVRDRRDRDAFLRLFEHFAPRLKAMLIRGGLRDGTAEDVVQDVMLSVWRKAGQFDPHRAEAGAWIYRIARNRRIDLVRRIPRPEAEYLCEPEGTEPDPAQILALGQEASALRHALGALAPEQARVLEQAYFEDLPHSRISEMTGLPLGTIKSRIRLGLARLRRELNDLRQP